ncbi:hypothetical protein EQG49_03730 [Periweissella cryptocerci]|uniref:NERD domain-containing protein n=1 Tax=Periweissella cryptocerci TaxID=2506420 RepID=A0A4P6YSF0_9LACO|nr:nuclease-related domain-containing protein [Periweissella cryptocerci]QBO35629.1 hypothetical protein EQG49_03730 [Periweissella cryptocerci]
MEFHGKVREIKPYDHRRHTGGYGFIQAENDQSIFFLLAWAKYEPVKVGDNVEFETELDEAGRIHANPVQRDETRMAANIKQLFQKYNYKSSRKLLPIPGVTAQSTNMSAAYESLNTIQQQFGEDNDALPATMLSTINEWISNVLELDTYFDEHPQLKELLIKRNVLPKQKQIEPLTELQKVIRKMNYEQRGRYFGVKGEQTVQSKLDQHHLQYVQNPTLPEFDTDGNVVGATEIDFIVVSMFGIHVIEVKNYGAGKGQEQRITISRDGQWSRIGSTQENVTGQNDLHISAVEGVLFDSDALQDIERVKLLAAPVFVIPNENVTINNQSSEQVIRTGFLYDTLVRNVRESRQAVLSESEVTRVLEVLKQALEANREFQYFLPDENFLEDAYQLRERYEIAQKVFDHLTDIYG